MNAITKIAKKELKKEKEMLSIMSKLIDFKRFKAKRNYKKLVKKMTCYYATLFPTAKPMKVLTLAVAEIENAKNRGNVNSMNELKGVCN